ncbi:MAG: response regulator [Myxococcales bacterium]|nr:response regulator [Myxococcales bacterium]
MSSRILIIDSDLGFAEKLAELCGHVGLDASTVDDGNEGFALAQSEHPAAVIIGLLDDRGSGYALCSKLRRRAPELPVIMIVDQGERGAERFERHRQLRTHADDYLLRPFVFGRLMAALAPRVPLEEPPPGVRDAVLDGPAGDGFFDAADLAEIAADHDGAFTALLDGLGLDPEDTPETPRRATPRIGEKGDDDETMQVRPVDDAALDQIAFDAPATAPATAPTDEPAAASPDDDVFAAVLEDRGDDDIPFVGFAGFGDKTVVTEIPAELDNREPATRSSPALPAARPRPARARRAPPEPPRPAPPPRAPRRSPPESDRDLRARIIELQQALKLAREENSRRQAP